jgi:DNA-binding NarL/FixJ family response regulator
MSERIRLLLVDDHVVVRAGFAALLNLQPDMRVVGQAATGQDGVRLYRELQPDVTLMDLNLPDIDGVAAIAAIRADSMDACIAVLTTYDHEERIQRALCAGARAYFIKTMEPTQLYRSIRALAAGAWSGPMPGPAKRREPLSQRELEVLERIVAGERNQTIADALGLSCNTVKTHVCHILAKLEAETRTQAVARALETGIVIRRRSGGEGVGAQ